MNWQTVEEPEEGSEDGDEEVDGLPDAEDAADGEEPLGPVAHLSDEDYDAFVASEFTSEGREKSDPPVAAILIGLTLLIVLLWLWLA